MRRTFTTLWILITLAECVSPLFCLGVPRTDSLLQKLKSSTPDSNRVKLMINIASDLLDNNPDTALLLNREAFALSEKLKWTKGMALALAEMGSCYRIKGDHPSALDCQLKALVKWEFLGDKQGICVSYSKLGGIYKDQGDLQNAMRYYEKALTMNKELGREQGIATALGNIANIYVDKEEYQKALDHYFAALEIGRKLNRKQTIANALGGIGSAYDGLGQTDKALEYYFECLDMNRQMNNRNRICVELGNIGGLLTDLGRYSEAEKYLKEALLYADSVDYLDAIKEYELSLSILYERTGDFRNALMHYRMHIEARDSIANEEATREQTRLEMQHDFDKKQAADSMINAERTIREQLRHEQEIGQQRTYTYGGIIGLVLMIVVAGVSFRAYRQKQKANEIISGQKIIVEEKQKEILDSIHYAKRIQLSLLPTQKYLDKQLKKLNG